jgi:DNA-binding LytR/AlgR family response regulator
VLEASNGMAALELLEAEKDVRLLFTDVGLPGGRNGRQVADEARRRRPDLLVHFTTGYTRNAIIHQGRLDPGAELDREAIHLCHPGRKDPTLTEARSLGNRTPWNI